MKHIRPLLLILATGCAKSPAPNPAITEPVAPVEAEVTVVEESEPSTSEPQAPPTNVNFSVRLTYADGRVHDGRVVYLERSNDWYAEEGYLDEARKLIVGLESGSDLIDVAFDEMGVVNISYGERNDFDCLYDSSFHPWMYMCTLKTTSVATLPDGSDWQLDSRHNWQLTFDDGSTESFYLLKFPVREQEASGAEDNTENYELYKRLQTTGMTDIKTALIKLEIL